MIEAVVYRTNSSLLAFKSDLLLIFSMCSMYEAQVNCASWLVFGLFL